MTYVEYLGLTYTIERVERYGEVKFLAIVYDKDDKVRTSSYYESLYEAEQLVRMTCSQLNVWYSQ